tara:strand:+ start:1385 stop:1711 length:327 start_codon:yes stop_codon:yes gene_type:complete
MSKAIESMRRATYKKLIQKHLEDMKGNHVEISMGGEMSLVTYTVDDAIEEVEAYADGAVVSLYADVEELGGPVRMGWFLVIHGLDPEETISDWSSNQYMDDLIGWSMP